MKKILFSMIALSCSFGFLSPSFAAALETLRMPGIVHEYDAATFMLTGVFMFEDSEATFLALLRDAHCPAFLAGDAIILSAGDSGQKIIKSSSGEECTLPDQVLYFITRKLEVSAAEPETNTLWASAENGEVYSLVHNGSCDDVDPSNHEPFYVGFGGMQLMMVFPTSGKMCPVYDFETIM